VDQLDAGQLGVGGAERFEVEYRSGYALNGVLILLDNIVEVFGLEHQNRPALISSIAALLAPLLSIATLSGPPFVPLALSRKRFAAAMSRFAVSMKSTVLPRLSVAR
jgi:hypothetical protein